MPHCRVQSPAEINVMIVPIAGCNNSIRYIEKSFFFTIFCLFFVFNAVWALTSSGFHVVCDTLVISETVNNTTKITIVYVLFLPLT